MIAEKIKLFDTYIHKIKFEDVTALTIEKINKREKVSIGYVNPHIVRLISSDRKLESALNKIDYLHADGFGMKVASKLLLKKDSIEPLNWTDHCIEYLRFCEKNNWRIFFLGSTDNILHKTIYRIKSLFPKLQISGHLNGFNQLNEESIDIINKSNANILWIGMGSPKQEIWLSENIDELNINVAQCVGDVFSFIAGERLRGPKFLRELGFEWIFRLIQHPIRYFNRYIIGIPYFLFLIIKFKLKLSSK